MGLAEQNVAKVLKKSRSAQPFFDLYQEKGRPGATKPANAWQTGAMALTLQCQSEEKTLERQ